MKRFEYKTVQVKPKGAWGAKFDIDEINKMLNEMGSQGWELLFIEQQKINYGNTACFLYTFKREI